jgi:hypothetical protein
VNDGHQQNPNLELLLDLHGMELIPGVGPEHTDTAALTKYPTASAPGEGEA